MRTLAALFCSLALAFAWDGGAKLLSAPLQPELDLLPQIECTTSPPATNWVCVNEIWVPPPGGSLPPPPPEPTPQVISVGEEVTGTLHPCCPAVFEILFELTAPSDGTLVVRLSSGAYLVLEDVYWSPTWRSPRVFSTWPRCRSPLVRHIVYWSFTPTGTSTASGRSS